MQVTLLTFLVARFQTCDTDSVLVMQISYLEVRKLKFNTVKNGAIGEGGFGNIPH